MINRLTYSVVFPTSGVSLKGEFKPQPGVTAVIGPNESGKTFTTIELTRYLLFGKKALRGAAADYKKLDAEGEFVIRGSVYTIARNSKKETVKDAVGTVLAVGPEEVTNKVISLLGYGLAVFDIANASVQKKASLFGDLRPADRKKLIDEVIDLVDYERAEKALRAEATTLKREAEAMTRTLTLPQEPTKPTDYLESTKLRSEYDTLSEIWDKAQLLANRMRPVDEPVEPNVTRVSYEDFQQLLSDRDAFVENEADRRRLQVIIDRDKDVVPYTREQLEAAAERLAINDLMANALTCPKCGEEFVPGHEHVTLPDGPDLTKEEIREALQALTVFDEAQSARAALAKLPKLTDPSDKLEAARDSRNAWDAYETAFAAAELQREKNIEAEKALRELGDLPNKADLDYMRERITDAQVYEKTYASYLDAKTAYDTNSGLIAEYTKRSADFKAGAELLTEARASIKSSLSPTLSAVASNLMDTMTRGKHTTITVDDDMEVLVGNQPLNTLSGGAATVANLALRLALGQVLVAGSFPVFLGDEMDSDADEDRRETVATALQTLIAKKLLKQVILVTHRSVDIADHVHDLTITE